MSGHFVRDRLERMCMLEESLLKFVAIARVLTSVACSRTNGFSREVVAWISGGTPGVGVALADDTGLEKAGDEGDVERDGVRYLIRGITSDKLLDPILELIGHDVSTAGVVISSRSAHLEVFDHVHTSEAHKRPELLERVPDLRIGVTTVVDDDIEVGAELLYPGVQHCEVALVARECLDSIELAFKLRFFYAISIVLSLPQFSFWQ
mmetsp:Transcript_61590/g.115950  ORF Transcript_61590/g.115950 Transcript_61590/m.115950 type:complete len:207 (+) Transcript_61590:250-870(+)